MGGKLSFFDVSYTSLTSKDNGERALKVPDKKLTISTGLTIQNSVLDLHTLMNQINLILEVLLLMHMII